MSTIVVTIIQLLHLVIIAGVLYGPFYKSLPTKMLYLVLVAGMAIHWVSNNSMCILSKLEAMARGVPLKHGFLNRLLTPLFQVNHMQAATIIYGVTVVLWLVVLYNLIMAPEWKDIKNAWNSPAERIQVLAIPFLPNTCENSQ